jgi:hypothetical protein
VVKLWSGLPATRGKLIAVQFAIHPETIMTTPSSTTPRSITETREIRWTARILSALFIGVFLPFFIGETFFQGPQAHRPPMTGNAILQLSIMGVCLLALSLAWRWELLGGTAALTAYIVLAFVNSEVLILPLFLVPLTALLFIACWWVGRKCDREESVAANSR